MARGIKRPFVIEDFFGISADGVLDDGWEKFLAEEGLELLASYRSIEDGQIRQALLELVKLVSKDVVMED